MGVPPFRILSDSMGRFVGSTYLTRLVTCLLACIGFVSVPLFAVEDTHNVENRWDNYFPGAKHRPAGTITSKAVSASENWAVSVGIEKTKMAAPLNIPFTLVGLGFGPSFDSSRVEVGVKFSPIASMLDGRRVLLIRQSAGTSLFESPGYFSLYAIYSRDFFSFLPMVGLEYFLLRDSHYDTSIYGINFELGIGKKLHFADAYFEPRFTVNYNYFGDVMTQYGPSLFRGFDGFGYSLSIITKLDL